MRKRVLINNSKIMTEQQKITLTSFFSDMRDKIKEVNLLFRASEHGQTTDDFHKRCDDKGSTVCIIKNDKGKEFGGFVKIPWNSTGWGTVDKEAFMFSLNLNQKYPYHQGTAIWCVPSNGCSFGGAGNEPCIGTDFNSKDSAGCWDSGNSFNIPGGPSTILGVENG